MKERNSDFDHILSIAGHPSTKSVMFHHHRSDPRFSPVMLHYYTLNESP